jgi:hypothetical protein
MLHGRFFRRVVELKTQFDGNPELPFSEALAEERINALVRELGVFYRERVYSPCVTLWIFLSQVLSTDHSCNDAVARLLAFRTARGQAACSTETGSYCQARQRLPEELLSRLTRQTGQELQREATATWRFCGRPVKVVDGSTVSMPDTPANEAAFGKPRNQRGAAGFPLARIVVLLCLATGAALELAIGPCRGKKTGELSLFRQLQHTLKAGDILLGDRLFCTYCDIARLQARGVDVVLRLHAHRKADFRRGRRLGHDDHLTTWHRPTHRPDWMTLEEFASLPVQLVLREVRVRVLITGFRVQSVVVVTTLTDPEQFSSEQITALFRQRWHAELDLRSIKSVMQMDVLRCKSPDMVRKEMWAHLLAYNLLRSVMCAAAVEHDLPVREISFKGTLQLLNAFHLSIVTSHSHHQLESLCTTLLAAVRERRVGKRPNRYEPRKCKRAAKPYPAMKLSRDQERKLCLRQAVR